MKKKILLIGGGGHCRSVIDVIELENRYEIAGIIDKKEFIGNDILGYKVIADDSALKDLRKDYDYAFITIGFIKSNKQRVCLFDTLKKLKFNIPTIISPLAYISKYSQIKEGSIVMHQALVNANAKIGKNCIINTKALIEHDVIIENNCHISTASIINGGVKVKENSFVGSNATTKEYINIDGFIKAGSLKK